MMSRTLLVLAVGLGLPGCDRAAGKNDLASLRTTEVVINDHTFHVWLAETPEQQRLGLMNVTADELPPDRGMLFVFDSDQHLTFWMKNTIIPLDIAFIDSSGLIVKTYTMPALTTQRFRSGKPARFALEVNAGRFAQLGIGPGDVVHIPADVLAAP